MDLEETSFLIWDLSNNCVVPNGTYDDLTNFDVSNQIITGSVFEFFALAIPRNQCNAMDLLV